MAMTVLDEARALLDDAIAVRRRIHHHPEIGLNLPETQKVVLEALEGLPLDVRTGKRATWVTATLEGAQPGPTVLLRGDMDALPMPEDTGLDFSSEVEGAMHACGHDTHVAMLLQAIQLLVDHRDQLHGRVLFMFQPGEEGYHGARVMIEEGLLDGQNSPSAAFAIHVVSYLPAGHIYTRPGPLLASSDKLDVTVKGRGGHASAPYLAQDPVPVACEIVQALQTMVTRKYNVFDPTVVTIASIHSGSTNNVIPEVANMEGTVRALTEETRESVLESVRRIIEGVAGAHGLVGELSVDSGYPPTINDEAMTSFSLEVARDVVGTELVEIMEHPVMGSEDFSYVLQRVPGAMLDLGVAPPEDPNPPANHSNRMMVEESALANGIALYAGLALRFLDGERAS
jgi:amidohydrolase